jgi:hypothetical protein
MTVRIGMNGFGRMGRLVGTLLSGWVYQTRELEGYLWRSTTFVLAAALLTFGLPEINQKAKINEAGSV